MRNFVCKNNFNRPAVHKTNKDYTRENFSVGFALDELHDSLVFDEEPPIYH